MKKSDELRIKTQKMIAKNLIILVVLAVVAFVGAFSWMTDATTADAKGITAKTEVIDGLEFYIVSPSDSDQYNSINAKLAENAAYNTAHPDETPKNTSWHEGSLTFDFTDPELKFMEDLFLCEVTGDGKTFTIPKLMQYGEIAYVDTDSDFEEAVANENYMSFDIYFRTKSRRDVSLMSSSKIAPKGAIDAATEDGMKNAAIGAVRMSVLNGSSRELLWIPGPCVWYDSLAQNGEGELHTNLTDFANKGSVYFDGNDLAYTSEATTDHAYYNTSKTRTVISGSDVTASTKNDYQLGKDVTVVSLDNADSVNGYYYGHVRINLWVEGEDSEARLKFVGGKFDMNLQFKLADL